MSQLEQIRQHRRTLRMPTALAIVDDLLQSAQKEDWSPATFLAELLDKEVEGRRLRRIERLQRASRLPAGKTRANFEQKALPLRLRRQLEELCAGGFVDCSENLLIFGLPGRGKTHFAAAVGHELVLRGRSVLFSPTFRLVDDLLRAKRDLLDEKPPERGGRPNDFSILSIREFSRGGLLISQTSFATSKRKERKPLGRGGRPNDFYP